MLNIRGYQLDVDVARELRSYDWSKPRWTGTKFLACSPFRADRIPSFVVWLNYGTWTDSGADDEDWKSGNFVKLLAFLRNESYEETEDYLLSEYCISYSNAEHLQLNIDLTQTQVSTDLLNNDILKRYAYRHPYLEKQRGIEEKWQQGFRVGYCKKSHAVTFPWFDYRGDLVNIKFRSVIDKRFWYYSGGQPVKNHIYGLNFVIKTRKNRVYIVESEIDAITLWQAGLAAVALGGANLTRQQRNLLLQSPVEELIIATDNDLAGQRIADSIVRQLSGYLDIKKINLPEQVKDVNELDKDKLLRITTHTHAVEFPPFI
ncbi:TOPRIM domain protein [Desulfofarcimen acetoxidans DSM 771]|uniref:TOPRIM domain protein n=1 Tax=Desulfofarcimen acetoxidans (strain ATCC 49208 / DSM 771 / KCTC 5769 / VKM B-1644 / 5575) TaxID=485916 RepID=C8VXQ8_DESAS|nr:toprim domain-containing protein [Desulfofarcimen acetoxidans]ACV62714.1 TOPRIM domain protein [Desulfofarcimen acetoxidans DSM 771]